MPKRDATDMPGSLTPEERITEEIIASSNWQDVVRKVHAAIRAAVAEEREACAQTAEAYDRQNFCAYGCAEHVATDIRSRPS